MPHFLFFCKNDIALAQTVAARFALLAKEAGRADIFVESTNAITIAISSASNVGPALGADIGPTMSWSSLPDAAKWICSALMLMGRLEFLSVLVLFTPAFWKEN